VLLVLAVGAGLIARSLLVAPDGQRPEPGVEGKVYLRAWTPTSTENWPWFPPPHPSGERPGEVIRVRGQVLPHGIFMHPPREPGTPASVTYSLRKGFTTFHAEVSLNDGPGRAEAPCTFWVYGDGRLLWQSSPVTSQQDAQACTVSVEGVDQLRLAVTCQGPPRGAHAVWVDPCVTR
jgi:hypothetical protein